MDNSASPLETLRQLKEMLDAGALTPAEFEALKQRLVLNQAPAPAPAAPTEPAPPLAAATTPPITPPPAARESDSTVFESVVSAQAFSPESAFPVPVVPAIPEAPVSAAWPPAEPEPVDGPVGRAADAFPASEELQAPPANNPLALVLSIGAILAFLGVVAYLMLNRPPSEHLSSTSQTAADSVAAVIETGPQADQPLLLPTEPETVRIAPARPAMPLPARPAPAPDSGATRATPDSAAGY